MTKKILIPILLVAALVALGLNLNSKDDPEKNTAEITNQTSTDQAPVIISSPTPNSIIENPVRFYGKAKPQWFTAGSFWVRLVDENGKILGSGNAAAMSDIANATSTDFIGTIGFDTTSSTIGKLIFTKEQPQADTPLPTDKIELPVRFK